MYAHFRGRGQAGRMGRPSQLVGQQIYDAAINMMERGLVTPGDKPTKFMEHEPILSIGVTDQTKRGHINTAKKDFLGKYLGLKSVFLFVVVF